MTWCQGTGTKKGRSLGNKENHSQGQSSVIHPSVSRDLGGDLRSQVSAGTQPGLPMPRGALLWLPTHFQVLFLMKEAPCSSGKGTHWKRTRQAQCPHPHFLEVLPLAFLYSSPGRRHEGAMQQQCLPGSSCRGLWEAATPSAYVL